MKENLDKQIDEFKNNGLEKAYWPSYTFQSLFVENTRFLQTELNKIWQGLANR